MTQIEQPTCALTEAIKPLLPPLLVQVADHRVLEGFRKYGQVLSDNHKPLRKKVVHHVQELLDALNYNEWELQDLTRHADHIPLMFEAMARRRTYIRHLFELMALVPDLTFDELTHKEGHSEADQLRADLAAAQARVAALEAENAALREQVSLLRLDNDGHMECLAETHQDLQRELPDSETTALLGRMLARWQRTPGQRQYVALSEVEGQAEALAKAERELAQERHSHSNTIDQRDAAHDAADRLAYALFDIDEIGEHSSSNCPWENAAERLEDMATPQQVSQ